MEASTAINVTTILRLSVTCSFMYMYQMSGYVLVFRLNNDIVASILPENRSSVCCLQLVHLCTYLKLKPCLIHIHKYVGMYINVYMHVHVYVYE